MESVAARGTGIAVLYRRWANKDEIALAALEHYRNRHTADLPDTGSLRGDLLAALTGMGETRAAFFVTLATTAYSGLLADTGLTPPRCATGSWASSGSPASRPSTGAPTSAVRSTWTGSPPGCSPCRSTWCATTCSWTSSPPARPHPVDRRRPLPAARPQPPAVRTEAVAARLRLVGRW